MSANFIHLHPYQRCLVYNHIHLRVGLLWFRDAREFRPFLYDAKRERPVELFGGKHKPRTCDQWDFLIANCLVIEL